MNPRRLAGLLVPWCIAAACPALAAPTPAAECANLKAQILHLQQSIAEMKGELANCHGCNAKMLNTAIKGMNEEIQADQVKIKYGCKPPPLPPKPPATQTSDPPGTPGPDNHFKVLGIEVTQVVQDLNNSVTLIAGKQTWVRVYVSKMVDDQPIVMKGTLRAAINATGSLITSDAVTIIDGKTTMPEERLDLNRSFNFLVPSDFTKAGSTNFSLLGFIDPTGHNEFYNCTNCADVSVNVTFVAMPPLRIRVVDLIYRHGATSQIAIPRAIDFTLLQSWLGRAYPVASIEISHTAALYDKDDTPQTNLDCHVADAVLLALRTSEVSAGMDDRTHYLGLVSNDLMKMRGCSNDIPLTPDPSSVTSLPTGAPTDVNIPADSAGDIDASFADYYGGHELAHTFGRQHPGVCPGNSHSDDMYPFPDGQISDGTDASFHGLDVGDAANGIARSVLPGVAKDNMTYCHQPRWWSPYHYEGIRKRLLDENPGFVTGPMSAKLPTPPKPMSRAKTASMIHVVALVEPDNHSGSFSSVFPVNRGTVSADLQSKAAIVFRDAKGGELLRQPVALRQWSDPPEDGKNRSGSIDADLPYRDGIARIELTLDDKTLAEFQVTGSAPAAVRNLRLESESRQPAKRVGEGVHLSWSGSDNATYIVDTSADGKNWNTIAVGVKAPQIALSAAHAQARYARVTATDGVHRSTTTSIAIAGR
jgi:hypothetical protein